MAGKYFQVEMTLWVSSSVGLNYSAPASHQGLLLWRLWQRSRDVNCLGSACAQRPRHCQVQSVPGTGCSQHPRTGCSWRDRLQGVRCQQIFPTENRASVGLQDSQADGHCWRGHRELCCWVSLSCQGSSWFLAHVTLRIRTPPPQETEHWEREMAVSPFGKDMLVLMLIYSKSGQASRKLELCAAKIISYLCIWLLCNFSFHRNMYILGRPAGGSGLTIIYPSQTEKPKHDMGKTQSLSGPELLDSGSARNIMI